MKTRLVCAVLLIGSTPSFGQSLDVLFHGPWMFYTEKKYGSDMTKPNILVAIAPANAGHNAPLFTTGDGISIDSGGFYCVAFTSGACPDGSSNIVNSISYPEPHLLPLFMPIDPWDWATLPHASNPPTPVPYVLILPMPNSWSADGQHIRYFDKQFPTQSTTSSKSNLGIYLHYTGAIDSVYLTSCKIPTPSRDPNGFVSCKPTDPVTKQDNTGTLRITMQIHHDPADTAKCEYHDHLAYQTMLNLVDPTLSQSMNQKLAFMGVDYTGHPDCAPCDPQNNNRTGCPDMTASIHRPKSDMPAIPEALTRIFTGLEECKNEQKVQTGNVNADFLSSRPNLAKNPKYKATRKSELDELIGWLDRSQNEINKRTKPKKAGACDAALQQEQTLMEAAAQKLIIVNGLDGIDCRASIIQIN